MNSNFTVYLNYNGWRLSRTSSDSSVCLKLSLQDSNYDKALSPAVCMDFFTEALTKKLQPSIIVLDDLANLALMKGDLLKLQTEDFEYNSDPIYAKIAREINDFRSHFRHDDVNDVCLRNAFDFLQLKLNASSNLLLDLVCYNFRYSEERVETNTCKYNKKSVETNFCKDAEAAIIPKNWHSRLDDYRIFFQNNMHIKTVFFAVGSILSGPNEIQQQYLLYESLKHMTTLIDCNEISIDLLQTPIRANFFTHLKVLKVHCSSDQLQLPFFFKTIPLLKKLENLTFWTKVWSRIFTTEATQLSLESCLCQNTCLTNFDTNLVAYHSTNLDYYLKRNNALQWKNAFKRLLEICLIFYMNETAFLPPYVILEIFDWLPLEKGCDERFKYISIMHLIPEILKVHLIENLLKSAKKIQRSRI